MSDHDIDPELKAHLADQEAQETPTPFDTLWSRAAVQHHNRARQRRARAFSGVAAAGVIAATAGLWQWSSNDNAAADLTSELTRTQMWQAPSDRLRSLDPALYAMQTPRLNWPNQTVVPKDES